MRIVTAVAAFSLLAVPAMAQVTITTGNPAQSEADRQAAHENWQGAREQNYRAQSDAARGDYQGAARHQAEANAERQAAHDDRAASQQSSGPSIVIGR